MESCLWSLNTTHINGMCSRLLIFISDCCSWMSEEAKKTSFAPSVRDFSKIPSRSKFLFARFSRLFPSHHIRSYTNRLLVFRNWILQKQFIKSPPAIPFIILERTPAAGSKISFNSFPPIQILFRRRWFRRSRFSRNQITDFFTSNRIKQIELIQCQKQAENSQ